jgi:hypothetical protein
MYSYNARFVEVIDGDTVLLYIDLGFYIWTMAGARLTGIDLLQDLSPIEIQREKQAVQWLEKRLADTEVLQIDTHKMPDGGITVDIISDGVTVNLEMERQGLLRGSVKLLGIVH